MTRFGSRGRGGAVWTAVWVPSPIVRLTGRRSLRSLFDGSDARRQSQSFGIRGLTTSHRGMRSGSQISDLIRRRWLAKVHRVLPERSRRAVGEC